MAANQHIPCSEPCFPHPRVRTLVPRGSNEDYICVYFLQPVGSLEGQPCGGSVQGLAMVRRGRGAHLTEDDRLWAPTTLGSLVSAPHVA